MNLREYAAQQQKPQKPAQQPTGAAAERQAAADPYKAVYRQVFDFHERHKPFPQTPEEWEEAVKDFAQTAEAAGGSPFALSLLTAVLDELERRWKGANSQ